MRADELGRRTPTTVFFDWALSTSKLRYHQNHQPKDQCTHAKKSPGKCYNPFPIPSIYNAASLESIIAWEVRHLSFVAWWTWYASFFIVLGLIFQLFWSLQLWLISLIPWIPLVYAVFLNVIVILLKPRHMSDHNWIKSEMRQSPPKRGTFLYHIW
jgi:hypothetical protein